MYCSLMQFSKYMSVTNLKIGMNSGISLLLGLSYLMYSIAVIAYFDMEGGWGLGKCLAVVLGTPYFFGFSFIVGLICRGRSHIGVFSVGLLCTKIKGQTNTTFVATTAATVIMY